MFQDLCGNLLILQCGQSSPASNAALAGIITEALNHEEKIEEIFGALNGTEGVLKEDFIDLAAESQQTIRALKTTPGAALGASHKAFRNEVEAKEALTILQSRNIRYVITIGDAQALEVAKSLNEAALSEGYAMSILMIPAAFDNSLSFSDHCIGYGSVAKTMATLMRQLAQGIQSSLHSSKVVLVEAPGAGGWVAAASTLAKRRNQSEDAPHLIYLPEAQWDDAQFIGNVQRNLERIGHCVVVFAEHLVDQNGNYLTNGEKPTGNRMFEHLQSLLQGHIQAPIEWVRMGELVLACGNLMSETDTQEALTAAQAAIEAAIEGKTGRMVALVRGQSDAYSCETSLVAFEDVSTTAKAFPTNWISDDQASVNHAFSQYAVPLIQGELESTFDNGILKMAKLDKRRAAKTSAKA